MKWIAALVCFALFSPGHLSSEKFRSPISLNEKRILDYKKEISNQNQSFPQSMKLFFQEKKGNYVIFHDWNGHSAYYQYRRNKFDHDNDTWIDRLLEGRAYKVSGKFMGMYITVLGAVPRFKPTPDLTIQEMKDPNSIPVFQLTDFKSLEINEILF